MSPPSFLPSLSPSVRVPSPVTVPCPGLGVPVSRAQTPTMPGTAGGRRGLQAVLRGKGAGRARAPRGGGGLCPHGCRCSPLPPVLAGHLAGLLAAGPACADAYRGLSDCVLKLGDSMATYEEEEGIELQGLHRVCR